MAAAPGVCASRCPTRHRNPPDQVAGGEGTREGQGGGGLSFTPFTRVCTHPPSSNSTSEDGHTATALRSLLWKGPHVWWLSVAKAAGWAHLMAAGDPCPMLRPPKEDAEQGDRWQGGGWLFSICAQAQQGGGWLKRCSDLGGLPAGHGVSMGVGGLRMRRTAPRNFGKGPQILPSAVSSPSSSTMAPITQLAKLSASSRRSRSLNGGVTVRAVRAQQAGAGLSPH